MRNLYLSIFLFIFSCGALFLGGICYFLHNHTIDFSRLQQDVAGKPSILLDRSGIEWGRFQLDKRKYVMLEMMPEHLIQAFLITEDRDFFKHPGISLKGIIRSILVNLYKGKRVQGASTITQQLVRLLFFNSSKTFSRKVKEQFYAILVERQWSKEQILEAYLNNVYFGYGIYGVQAAAQRFWGIDIQDVSIEQAATLASVMRSPQYYSPIHAPDSVIKRRNMILKLMKDFHVISQGQYDKAVSQPLMIKDPDFNVIAPHLKETIRIFLEDLFGKEKLYAGGLVIQTTIDIQMQKACQQAFESHLTYLHQTMNPDVDGGLISLDSQTGEIRVMIGGYDFRKSKLNRAMQAYRQMGSICKIFVYAVALQQGLKLTDVEIDEPIELMQNNQLWCPKNHNNKFLGPMTRAYALSFSNNMVAIKTLLQVGVMPVIDLARRCHITATIPPYPSLALGCIDVNVLETVGAFNTFVNHGKYVQPHFLHWVKNNVGEKIYKTSVRKEQIIDPVITGQICRVLTFSIPRLKTKLKYLIGDNWFGSEALCKTGTTNDSRNCWFFGATPDLTTAIYIGCDNYDSLGNNVYSSKVAFPIWFRFHEKIEKKKTNFYYDPKLHEVLVNWKTGVLNDDKHQEDVVTLLQ